jgi:hypothetical protein
MEVDIQMMAFLNEEQDGTKKNALFIRSREQLAELEATITELRAAESQHHRAAQTLAAAREKAARHASVQVRTFTLCCFRMVRNYAGHRTQYLFMICEFEGSSLRMEQQVVSMNVDDDMVTPG